jgi:tol-pal system protein YbgF
MIQLRWQVQAILMGLFLGLVSMAPAFAQSKDLKPILDRLQRIERDVKTLNIQVSRGGTADGAVVGSSSSSARVAVKLTDLEYELRTTTGKVETVAQQIEEISLRLDKLIIDMDYRLNALEGSSTRSSQKVRASPSPGGVQQVMPGSSQSRVLGTLPQTETPAVPRETGEDQNDATLPAGTEVTSNTLVGQQLKAPGILPEGRPADRYAYAVGLLRQGDYEQAEKAFNEFMVAHPADDLTDNARYWLAESYYVRGQYVQAAEFFMAGYQANASAAKAPDMLLKLGMSLSKLDKKKDACASFAKLRGDFPKASVRILKKVAFESKNIGCK